MKAVLFDLDDTLYSEMEFVQSGFKRVANYLGSRYRLDENVLFARMVEILYKDGRGSVFDTLLRDFGMYEMERVMLLLYVYRSHRPAIQLYEDALPTLESLRGMGIQLGIITDGMASVQRRKVESLGLEGLVDVIVYTDEVGRDYWKPSVIPYLIAGDLLNVPLSESIYVGNDPTKDFLGANTLGMLTVQVERSVKQDCVRLGGADISAPRFVVGGLEAVLQVVGGGCDA